MAKTPKKPVRGGTPRAMHPRVTVDKMMAKGGPQAEALRYAAGYGAGQAVRRMRAAAPVRSPIPSGGLQRPMPRPMTPPAGLVRAAPPPAVTRPPMAPRPPVVPARPMLPRGGLMRPIRPRGY